MRTVGIYDGRRSPDDRRRPPDRAPSASVGDLRRSVVRRSPDDRRRSPDRTSSTLGDFRRSVGTWGHLAFLIWAITLSLLAPGGRLVLVLGTVIAFSTLFFQEGLRPIRRLEFWALVASAVVFSPLLIGEKDFSLLGIPISSQGFWAGLWMALRAVSVALAVGGFAYAVSADEMARLFEMAGLRGLGFAVGVAFNMLPTLEETARNVYEAMRLRGGFRQERLQALRMLLVTIVVNALRRGEEVVEAAEARAFRPDGPRREPLPFTRLDLAMITLLIVLGVVLVA